jgi:hypothetical protein
LSFSSSFGAYRALSAALLARTFFERILLPIFATDNNTGVEERYYKILDNEVYIQRAVGQNSTNEEAPQFNKECN